MKQTNEEWESEFKETLLARSGGSCFEAVDYEMIVSDMKFFIQSLLSLQKQKIIEMCQLQEQKMKETHFCGFNDGESRCPCYCSALSDILSAIKDIKV